MTVMDINDLDKEIEKIKFPDVQRKRGINTKVKNASLKIILSRLLSVALMGIITGIGLYIILKAKSYSGSSSSLFITIIILYIAIGGLVAYKLWNLEFIGWLSMFFISLAGIFLPILSLITRGLMIGTIPIMVTSLIFFVILWWVKDLFNVERFSDIFKPH